ncbi:MAG: N-acetylmuramoyl-L-alanine amidase [Verrucomicrobiota bacterium]|nr:N-acetylmuramoyl-L-alanine amidase [Verrucomicrobiota bacterium]
MFHLFLVIGLIFLTGCPSPPKQQPKVTPLLVIPAEPLNTPSPVITEATPPPPQPPVQPSFKPPGPPRTNWINFSVWAATNGWKPLLPQSIGTISNSYLFSSPNGSFELRPGQPFGRWNGTAFAWGFPPQLTNSALWINQLDLEKNLIPLQYSPSLGKGGTIVLDPGHGGENSGARSRDGAVLEKFAVMDWARRIQKLLEKEGFRVVLTRTNDLDIPLTNRVAVAEQAKGDLFISLHFNSVDSPNDEAGIETFCLTPTGMPSTLTRGYDDDPGRRFQNNDHDIANFQFAIRIHQKMIQQTGRKDRGVRRARFMGVLREQNRPAVLLEGGFLSSPGEAALIGSADYREKLAEAVAEAIKSL